ncbi:MAG TPA: hypothetical protein IAA58_05905 [Candidatus Gallacutalibacter stercoravium]|nr:hypothetical protein [Candidatus Gallacutalibacter stercoravium]
MKNHTGVSFGAASTTPAALAASAAPAANEKRKAQYLRALQKSPRLHRAALALPASRGALETACSYALAPALAGFVQWLLDRAVRSGKKRLYFLARDGYFFYQAALILCKSHGLPLDCRYLSCSRYALRLPLYHLDPQEALSDICRGGTEVTLERILRRAGLQEEEVRQVQDRLAPKLAPALNSGAPLSQQYLPEIRRLLAACPLFLADMNRRSKEALPGLAGYLRQEGLLQEESAAIVDSGWLGSMQQTLNQALALLGRKQKLEGYYWGLYDLPAQADPGGYHYYFFSPQGPLRAKARFNNCLFEAVFTAPHGMTLSYVLQNGRFAPYYGPISGAKQKAVQTIGAYLMRYIRLLAAQGRQHEGPLSLPQEQDFARDRAAIQRLFFLLSARPTPEEAQALGSLPFSDDVVEDPHSVLAPLLTEEELKAGHPLRRLLSPPGAGMRASAWYEGSAVRRGRKARYHLWQHGLYQYLRHGAGRYRYIRKRREAKKHG